MAGHHLRQSLGSIFAAFAMRPAISMSQLQLRAEFQRRIANQLESIRGRLLAQLGRLSAFMTAAFNASTTFLGKPGGPNSGVHVGGGSNLGTAAASSCVSSLLPASV